LFEEGFARLTVERVAARSGASRMTIHKWWPSRGALAFEAYRSAVDENLKFPQTGDLKDDLRTQLHAFVRHLTESPAGRLIAELVGESQMDAELRAALIEEYSGPRRALAIERMRQGQAMGQMRDDVDPSIVVDQLWGACYHRLLLGSNLPITIEFVDGLLENIFAGVAPRPATGRRPGGG
jgi:AcrR family transcriptional regulator